MQSQFLAEIDFPEIIKQAFPNYEPGVIDITKTNLSLGDILSALLPYIFVLAGLTLLLYLVWGGFQLMLSGGDPQKASAAKGKITSAIVGFVIIFVAYWLIQILQVIFGLPKVF